MGLEILIPLVALVTTIISVFITWATARYNSRKDKREDTETRIRELARDEDAPLKDLLYSHSTRLAQDGDTLSRLTTVLDKIDDSLDNAKERLARVEANQNQITESIVTQLMKMMQQPHPERQRLDYLFQAYMDNAITEDEYLELKKLLVEIRNWLPGKSIGFPVQPWEPTAAALLLGTMDQTNPQSIASMQHTVPVNPNHTSPNEDKQ